MKKIAMCNKFERETNIVVYSGKVTDSVEGRCADDRERTQHTNCSKGVKLVSLWQNAEVHVSFFPSDVCLTILSASSA